MFELIREFSNPFNQFEVPSNHMMSQGHNPMPSPAGLPDNSVAGSQVDSQLGGTGGHPNSHGSTQGDVPVDLGAAMLQSPIIRDRRRDSLLTVATLNAMHLHDANARMVRYRLTRKCSATDLELQDDHGQMGREDSTE